MKDSVGAVEHNDTSRDPHDPGCQGRDIGDDDEQEEDACGSYGFKDAKTELSCPEAFDP